MWGAKKLCVCMCGGEFTERIEHSTESKVDISTTYIGGKAIGHKVSLARFIESTD